MQSIRLKGTRHMVNAIKKLSLLLLVVFTLVGCGVVLDDGKIVGTWELTSSEFYVYNEIVDSYITYTGSTTEELGDKVPVLGSFFWTKASSVTITFDANGEFFVEAVDDAGDTVKIVDSTFTSWSIDTFENSLTMKVQSSAKVNYGIWSKDFNICIDWPLATPQTMEMLIKSDDFGMESFDITGTGINATMIKGYFTKQ